MRVETQRTVGAVLVAVMAMMFGGMVLLLPGAIREGGIPRPSPPRVTERVAAVEGVFCGALEESPGLDPRFGTALSQSGELQHQTLGALAGRWGQDGSSGARAQVLLECRRLGLTS